ncbi:uncharacterized protein LOC119738161 isoform X2 [Patiria miniata]|uniref:Ig-like domain-containing protein n=1 Tax=Patiria miniata TaxID=46514 RepID=A0A914B004_PATMI|nr:uncharacterized protein LOC119738161 isoform X2 [Patiria miniata]
MIQAHKADLWMVLLLVIIVVVTRIQASSNEDGTIFLERGNPGILSCPPVASGRIPLGQIIAMYWYFPRVRDEDILISYFFGNVGPQNGIPEGVYDINGNFSLVIENVTDSDEGTYYCRVKPRLRMMVDGHVAMRVKVSPKEPFPDVTQCTERISETACEAVLPNDIEKPMLTCIVRDAKPAVALRWLLENSDGGTQLISDRFTVQPSEYSVNTFTTSASIPIVASDVDTMYRCQAYGEALGARNGSHVTVTVTTAHRTLQTPLVSVVATGIQASSNEGGTIFLERGNPGILSCAPVASGQIPLNQIDGMRWYFRQIREENLLISYFLKKVTLQNGIPEGVYGINGNFSLVIENVTDSDEGTYYCKVTDRGKKALVNGNVTMHVKVSPKEQFPDITQCTQRISETACEAELPNDIKKPRLTCIVRDTKPAVALRWLLEYSDGDTHLISDRFTVQPSEYSANTFTTSASIPIIASPVDTMYRCQAYGEALGARSGSYVTVTVTTTHHTPLAPSSAVTIKEAPCTLHNAVIGPADTPDGYGYAFIGTAVFLCLVIVGLVIVLCKKHSKADNSRENGAAEMQDPRVNSGKWTWIRKSWSHLTRTDMV